MLLPLLPPLTFSAGCASFLKNGFLFSASGAAWEGGGVDAANDAFEAAVGDVEGIDVTPNADDIEVSTVLTSDSRSILLLS